MPNPASAISSSTIASRPRRPKPRGRWRSIAVKLLVALLVVPGALLAFGVRPTWLFKPKSEFQLVRVDKGDVSVVLVEAGALENSDNATVRCKVEALLGTVGAQGQGMMGAGGGGGANRGGGGGGGAGMGNRGGNRNTQNSFAAAASRATTKTGAQAKGAAGAGTTKAGTNNATGTAATGSNPMAGGSAGGLVQRPVVTSFSFRVEPHVPLRPQTQNANQASTINMAQQMAAQQNRGGGMAQDNQTGSTRILKILEEGKEVREGDVVCELDASAFEDELRAEMIKWVQAKSWVEQAEKALEVANIALREYKEGVFPQDLKLLEDYITTCEVQRDQSKMKLEWVTGMFKRGLQSDSQVRGATLELERNEVALNDGLSMKNQLVNYTMPKLVANLEAKIASVQSDLEAQRAAFALEDQRKHRLEVAIANCTLRAPRSGMVVYANQANRWGQVDNPIREGVTVRENQPLFQIPNSSRMKVKARINETKVALVKGGTRALIRVEALPGKIIQGSVDEVTAIPAPANGPISDVKQYFANVEFDAGEYDGVRPGMTARVEFLVETRPEVTRVPIRALRWFDGAPFVALPTGEHGYEWRRLTLGVSDDHYIEVQDGIEAGREVIADPSKLEPPSESQRAKFQQLASSGAPAAG